MRGRWRSGGTLRLGVTLCLMIGALVLLGLVWTPYAPQAMDFAHAMAGPSRAHLLGTDDFGRDLLSRILVGMRIDLLVSAASVVVGGGVGVVLGLLTARLRGVLAEAAMRLIDLLYAFPAILTALMLVAVLGSTPVSLVVALAVVNVPVFARLTRSMALSVQETEFVEAARSMGASPWRIVTRHVLPGVVPTLVVQAATAMSGAFFTEAALSFLGLGIQPPTPTLGNMLSEAQSFVATDPWMPMPTGLAVALCVLAFNTLGDGLRDRLSPAGGRRRRQETAVARAGARKEGRAATGKADAAAALEI